MKPVRVRKTPVRVRKTSVGGVAAGGRGGWAGEGGCRVRENAHGVRNRLCRIAEQRRRGHGLNFARRKGKQARRKGKQAWRPLGQVAA